MECCKNKYPKVNFWSSSRVGGLIAWIWDLKGMRALTVILHSLDIRLSVEARNGFVIWVSVVRPSFFACWIIYLSSVATVFQKTISPGTPSILASSFKCSPKLVKHRGPCRIPLQYLLSVLLPQAFQNTHTCNVAQVMSASLIQNFKLSIHYFAFRFQFQQLPTSNQNVYIPYPLNHLTNML